MIRRTFMRRMAHAAMAGMLGAELAWRAPKMELYVTKYFTVMPRSSSDVKQAKVVEDFLNWAVRDRPDLLPEWGVVTNEELRSSIDAVAAMQRLR